MTAAKTTTRARRTGSGPGIIPAAVAAWFAAPAGPAPWEALLHPDAESMPGWWRQWTAEHPGATPPAAPWINWSAAA